MNPPLTIKVAHLDYRVLLCSRASTDDEERLGECDNEKLHIRIQRDLAPRAMAEILLHETMHAIYSAWKVADPLTEEQAVAAGAAGLCCVIRQNPRLVAYLTEALA